MAFEEYYLKEFTQFKKIMPLWQNDNAIIVCRYQNAEKEINVETVNKIGIQWIKRSTAESTIYHELGNLNYSLIFSFDIEDEMVFFAS